MSIEIVSCLYVILFQVLIFYLISGSGSFIISVLGLSPNTLEIILYRNNYNTLKADSLFLIAFVNACCC